MGNDAVASTYRRMPESPAARAAPSIINAPYVYGVWPSGNCVVARLQRCTGGRAPSRVAVRATVRDSVLTSRPLPVSNDS